MLFFSNGRNNPTDFFQISNLKLQISNKFQFSILKFQTKARLMTTQLLVLVIFNLSFIKPVGGQVWNLSFWYLKFICYLPFVFWNFFIPRVVSIR